MIEGVTIHYASRIEDVLAVALPLLKARPDVTPIVPRERRRSRCITQRSAVGKGRRICRPFFGAGREPTDASTESRFIRLTRRRYAFNTMQVRVFPFGILRESLGSDAFVVELAGDATVAELLVRIGARNPAVQLRGIAVSVNAEYANPSQVLRNEDEVGLLPPVSGGSAGKSDAPTEADTSMATALTREPIDAEKLVAAAKRGEDGAVVVFDGIVRNHSRGRQTLYLDYEAYEEMALKQMDELAREARSRFSVRQVTIVHRLGRLKIFLTSSD